MSELKYVPKSYIVVAEPDVFNNFDMNFMKVSSQILTYYEALTKM